MPTEKIGVKICKNQSKIKNENYMIAQSSQDQLTGSNMSDWESSVLKSAEPAKTKPAMLGLSLEMKSCTAVSATWKQEREQYYHQPVCDGFLATGEYPP